MRPAVVTYHGPGLSSSTRARADVRAIGGTPFTKAYAREGAGVVPRFADLYPGRPVILVAWSEGVQAIRSHIRDGGALESGRLAGVVVLDGAHASDPPDDRTQLEPWRRLRASRVPVLFTSSRVPTSGYLSTREVVRRLGWPTVDGAHELRDGFRLELTPGGNGAEHIRHADMGAAAVGAMLDQLERDGLPPTGGPGAAVLGAALLAAAAWYARVRGWW